MVCNGIINILSGFFIFIVCDNLNFFHRNIPSDNILPDMLVCFIKGSIIDIYNMIVWVILHKNRVQIPQVQTCFNILVRWNYDTERKLFFFMLTDFIVHLKILSLGFDKFCYSLSFLNFVMIKHCQFDLNLSSILYIVGNL